ncbi:pyridoxamine 5'-phosphate oxidase family protein, partial [Limnohabitans sp.]|uniref:pyridoxamine 5'-phosphate oxidase family protein n=1 Tax=Limnohabitans sp. TaxID=1907725 RepID=UPI00334005C1
MRPDLLGCWKCASSERFTRRRVPMTLLHEPVQEAARRSVLCWLATVDAEGQPNVSPKEVWAIA